MAAVHPHLFVVSQQIEIRIRLVAINQRDRPTIDKGTREKRHRLAESLFGALVAFLLLQIIKKTEREREYF
jgi:hypothetical protein